MSRRMRRLLTVAALLVVAAVAAGSAIFFRQYRAELRREGDRLAALLQVRPGMVVAEIGAGSGRLAVQLARLLGPSGRLYATEIDPRKVEAIRRAASASGRGNITPLLVGEHDAGLPNNCCDVIFMRRVYHDLTDPPAVTRTVYAALKPGGRLGVIDFISPRWAFWVHHGIESDRIVTALGNAGFVLERRVDGWSPIDYCLIFRKRENAGTPVGVP